MTPAQTLIRGAAACAAAVALAALAGCGGAAPGDGAPPPGLVFDSPSQVAAQRAAKDETYRRDPDSPIAPPLRAAFRALDYYPHSPEWVFAVKMRRYPSPVPLRIVTTNGQVRPAVKYGYVEIPREGRLHRLQVYQLQDLPERFRGSLFLPFLDAGSGKESYGAGRYLDLAPGIDDWYVVDFNQAYHPLCAYGRINDYQCPRTPEENRLPFVVAAGERGWAGPHTAPPAPPTTN